MVYGNMSQEKKPPYSRVTSRLVKYINFDHLKGELLSSYSITTGEHINIIFGKKILHPPGSTNSSLAGKSPTLNSLQSRSIFQPAMLEKTGGELHQLPGVEALGGDTFGPEGAHRSLGHDDFFGDTG